MSQPAPSQPQHERAALNQAAKTLADQLGETRHDARESVERLVRHYGLPFTSDLYQRALEVEKDGGLLTGDGKRRTLGGVFFYLAKEAVGIEAFRNIIPLPWKVARNRRRAAKKRLAEAAAKAARDEQTALFPGVKAPA